MDRIIPDIDWCRKISTELGVPTRCPFSTVDECPRYYQSLSLLSSAGHTAIPSDKDEMLLKKWKRSSLWPTIKEQATSVSGAPERRKTFSNFCPEVAYDRFGLFASELYPYHDEINHDNGIKFGRQEIMPDGHWVFNWSHVLKVHYTDCPIYSPLKAKGSSANNGESLLEKILKKISNNPLIATLIIVSTIVVGIGTFTDALLKIQNGFVKIYQNIEPSKNIEKKPKNISAPIPIKKHWSVERGEALHAQYMKLDWENVPEMKLEINTDGGNLTIKWGLMLGSNNADLSANARILIDGRESTKYVSDGDNTNIRQIGVNNEGFSGGNPISSDPAIGNWQRTRYHSRQFTVRNLPKGNHTIQMQRCITNNDTGKRLHTDFWWYSYDRSITINIGGRA